MLGLSAQLVLGITETCVWTLCVSVCDCSASKSDSGQVAMKCKEDFFFFRQFSGRASWKNVVLCSVHPWTEHAGELERRVSLTTHIPAWLPLPIFCFTKSLSTLLFPSVLAPPFASSPLLVIHHVNEALVIFSEQEVC